MGGDQGENGDGRRKDCGLDRGAGRRRGRRAGRRVRRRRDRPSVLHLGIGDRLLPGGHRQGARPGRQQPDPADRRAARACEPQRRARLRGGERPARRDRGPCRLRHDALRRRRPYRGAEPPAGGHHRRLPADLLCRDAQGRARRGRASLDAGDVRPERDRPQLRQVGPPADLAGQPRHHRQPRGAGDAERALRPGLSELPQGAHFAPGRRRQLPERRPARHPAPRRAVPRGRGRGRAQADRGGPSGRGGVGLGARPGDGAGAGRALRAARPRGRGFGAAELYELPVPPPLLPGPGGARRRRRGAGARGGRPLGAGAGRAGGGRVRDLGRARSDRGQPSRPSSSPPTCASPPTRSRRSGR